MIVFKQLNPVDVLEVAKNAIDSLPRNASEAKLLEYAEFHRNNGTAFTGYIDNKPVLVAGFHRRHKNDGVLWSIISKDAIKYKKTMFKSIGIFTPPTCWFLKHFAKCGKKTTPQTVAK